VGETRVDLFHLLEDLRDAYPGSTEETILTEIIANSLDSGASIITIATDPAEPTLTVMDDGYLAYRKAIQEAVSRQLAAWGDAGEPDERARRRAARPVERDLEAVLADLADEFPLLAPLVEQRAGGQRRLPTADSSHGQDVRRESLPVLAAAASRDPKGTPPGEEYSAPPPPAPATGHVAGAPRTRRPVRYGLSIQFESRQDDAEIAHLVESTVWVNEEHPAYRRAAASRSEGYHVALAVALALAPLAVDPVKEHAFIITFLARWGAAIERRGRGRRR
jgi:hypothetical protein